MTFLARSEDVRQWLLQYHTLRAHEVARGERTEECPRLPMFINDTQVDVTLVEPFVGDEMLIVFVPWGNYYLGAILAPTSNNTWEAHCPPKRIDKDAIGRRNLDIQVSILQLLARQ